MTTNLEELKRQVSALQSEIDKLSNQSKDTATPETAEAVPQPVSHRVIHVQVAGAPSIETLKQVADLFNRSLATNADVVIPTNVQVSARVLAVDPANPIQGLLVRGALDVHTIVRVAYATYAAFTKQDLDWSALPPHHQEAFAQDIVAYLHHGTTSPTWKDAAPVMTASIGVLKALLPTPEDRQMPVDITTHSINANGETFTVWETRDLRELKAGDIFRATGASEPVYRARTDAFISYLVPEGAAYSITADPLDSEQFPRHPDWVPEVGGPSGEELHSAGIANAEAQDSDDATDVEAKRVADMAEGYRQLESNDFTS